jgi:hypothetical protein
MAPLLLLLAILLPFAWLASEFQSRRWLRITLGLGALVGVFCISAILSVMDGIDSNSYFSVANCELLDSTIDGLASEQSDVVLKELRSFRDNYEPTYENRSNYQEKVAAYSKKLKDQRSNELD